MVLHRLLNTNLRGSGHIDNPNPDEDQEVLVTLLRSEYDLLKQMIRNYRECSSKTDLTCD